MYLLVLEQPIINHKKVEIQERVEDNTLVLSLELMFYFHNKPKLRCLLNKLRQQGP